MAQTTTQVFAAKLIAWRKELGWTQDRLATEIRANGGTMSRQALAKVEKGYRAEVELTEVFATARALNVAPADLILPDDENELVQLLPDTEPMGAYFARLWIEGTETPFAANEAERDAFFRHASHRVQTDREAWKFPQLKALASLTGVATGILVGDQNGPVSTKGMAELIRRELDRVNRHLELLCEDLEAADAMVQPGDRLKLVAEGEAR